MSDLTARGNSGKDDPSAGEKSPPRELVPKPGKPQNQGKPTQRGVMPPNDTGGPQ